jgi:protein KTI12
MPLVVLCGPPCSGKTRRAQALAEAARRRGVDSVELVNEESLKISRTQAYASANAEKDARSLFRATVQRLLSTRTLVLADSLNLFKSMRYELYCRAREVATSSCVVFCDTPAERCREWNAAREPELRYEEKALEDLISRMEPPDAARRWDYPLFVATVRAVAQPRCVRASLLTRTRARAHAPSRSPRTRSPTRRCRSMKCSTACSRRRRCGLLWPPSRCAPWARACSRVRVRVR